jgi:hypothetical protein
MIFQTLRCWFSSFGSLCSRFHCFVYAFWTLLRYLLTDKETLPKTVNDVKLINAGMILENGKTLAESRSGWSDWKCVITMLLSLGSQFLDMHQRWKKLVLLSEDQFCRRRCIVVPHLLPNCHVACLSERPGNRLVRNWFYLDSMPYFTWCQWQSTQVQNWAQIVTVC